MRGIDLTEEKESIDLYDLQTFRITVVSESGIRGRLVIHVNSI